MLVADELERAGVQPIGLLQALAALGLLGSDPQRLGCPHDRRSDRAALDLAREPAGLLEVVGMRLGELVPLLAGREPVGAADVQLGPEALREPLVGHVADQGVLERELALAPDGRGRPLIGDVQPGERLESSLDVVHHAVQRRDEARRRSPDHGGAQARCFSRSGSRSRRAPIMERRVEGAAGPG
jgi:hypothetical protein